MTKGLSALLLAACMKLSFPFLASTGSLFGPFSASLGVSRATAFSSFSVVDAIFVELKENVSVSLNSIKRVLRHQWKRYNTIVPTASGYVFDCFRFAMTINRALDCQ